MDHEFHTRQREMDAAIEYTAAETGFSLNLIEKDYWCSILLRELFAMEDLNLVFKGGTLLSKGFAKFERLSEDLDFTIPTRPEDSRTIRRRRARDIRDQLDGLVEGKGLRWQEEWRGHNVSTQYTGRIAYPSRYKKQSSILIEISQREMSVLPPVQTELRTLLREPINDEPALEPFMGTTLSRQEAYAEKVRAALTRQRPAIRDIYDLWQGHEAGFFDPGDDVWLGIVRHKCHGNDIAAACAEKRLDVFQRGISTELTPVLRSGKAEEFPIDGALLLLQDIHAKLVKS